jgi:hypothetical protein
MVSSVRTTVNIDEHVLAEAKLIAARSHRTIGSVMEDALRRLIEAESVTSHVAEPYVLPAFRPHDPALRAGVDLHDKEQLADLQGDNDLPRPHAAPPRER